MELAQLWRLGNIGSKKIGDQGPYMRKIIVLNMIGSIRKIELCQNLKKYSLRNLGLGIILTQWIFIVVIGLLRQLLGQITFAITMHLGLILVFAKLLHYIIVVHCVGNQWQQRLGQHGKRNEKD